MSRPAFIWQSIDPRTGEEVPYSPADQIAIESAFQARQPSYSLRLGTMMFTIDFKSMSQRNMTGGSRSVQRIDLAAAADRQARLAAPISPELAVSCLEAISAMDLLTVEAERNISDRTHVVAIESIPNFKSVLLVYEYIFAELAKPALSRKFGGSERSAMLLEMGEGGDVPNYFANVSGESVYHRKVLSVLGLRNLVRAGCDIFNELKATLFSGDPSHYSGRSGLGKMRALTGNTVDLDTMVANCEHQLKLFNAVRQKATPPLPPFRSAEELAKSADCQAYVRSVAEPLLDEFVDRMKLSPREAEQRRVLKTSLTGSIPVSSGNSDRGRSPIWLYAGAGVLTYHVNVPNMLDVFGALLKAPYHAARAFLLLYEKNHGTAKWSEAVEEYFDECISDSCFNGKWKSIEMYLDKIERIGSINEVLDQLQREFQSVFTPAFFDADPDRVKERAEMVRLVQLHRKQGVGADGKKRLISAADVDAWIVRSS
jgi:hypothetical protein